MDNVKTAADPQQRAQWARFANGLHDLNRRWAKTRADIFWLEKATEYYRAKHDGAMPPSFTAKNVPQLQKAATAWMQGITALNNAYALSQSGSAFIAPSKTHPGDIDLMIEKGTVPQKVIDNATFSKMSIPEDPNFGWIIPVVIAGAVITGLVLISGMVDSVTETVVKHKRIDANIERVKRSVEKDILSNASPAIVKDFIDFKKKEIEPTEKGFLASAGQAAGGVVGVALIGLVLFMIWQKYGGKK